MVPPLVFTEAADMRQFSRDCRRNGRSIGFVPTMGYLHEGHISLVLAAKEKCDIVIASIYVNPTQFSKDEDFGVYPRSQDADLEKLGEAGCAAVFMPRTLYHQPPSSGAADGSMVVGANEDIDYNSHCTWINVDYLSQGLCAGSRPHFFRGVCTVVAKLFNIVEPDVACFGKKDYQQWRVLERMARDLDFAIEIIGMPIQRESDGLAMSSRNALLTPEHRAASPCIYKALIAAKEEVLSGGISSIEDLRAQISSAIELGGGRIDYVQIVDAESLRPILKIGSSEDRQPMLIAVAAHFGKVRLIDNVDF